MTLKQGIWCHAICLFHIHNWGVLSVLNMTRRSVWLSNQRAVEPKFDGSSAYNRGDFSQENNGVNEIKLCVSTNPSRQLNLNARTPITGDILKRGDVLQYWLVNLQIHTLNVYSNREVAWGNIIVHLVLALLLNYQHGCIWKATNFTLFIPCL